MVSRFPISDAPISGKSSGKGTTLVECLTGDLTLTLTQGIDPGTGSELPCCEQLPWSQEYTINQVYRSMVYWSSDLVELYYLPCAAGPETGATYHYIQWFFRCDYENDALWKLSWWPYHGQYDDRSCLELPDMAVAPTDWEWDFISADCDPFTIEFSKTLYVGPTTVQADIGPCFREDQDTDPNNCLYYDDYSCPLFVTITQ